MDRRQLIEFYKERMEWVKKQYLGVRPYSIRKPKKEPKSESIPSRLRVYPSELRVFPPR